MSETHASHATHATHFRYTCADCGATSDSLESEDPYTTQTYGNLVAMQYHVMDHHHIGRDELRHGALSERGVRPNRNFEFCVGQKLVFSAQEVGTA